MVESKKFNFTKKKLEDLCIPTTGKRNYHYDTKTQGLGVCVTPSGTKTFIVYRKIEGRPERITLKCFPGMSIEQARGQAAEINSAIAKGENPAKKHRFGRAEITLGELCEQYLNRYAKDHKLSWKLDERQFNCYLSNWRQRKLSSIRRHDIQKLHQEVGHKNGHYAANRLLALLSSMFNQANRLCLWDKSNPATGIKKFKEQSRERFLQGDELPRFFTALSEEINENARDYILLSLLTGARKSNVLAMCWTEVNLEVGLWKIPRTKNGDSHTIPLVPQALDVLKNRFTVKQSEWVFPSNGKSGHFVDPKRAWKRLLERAGISDLRIHDLRRSLGSWQATTGASLSIIGKTLAHKSVNTTAIYARLNIDPVRDAMNKATQAILVAGNIIAPEGKSQVIVIKK